MARTNIDLDEQLVSKAMRLGRIKTMKEVVHRALEEYVASRSKRRRSLARYAGKFEFYEGFDPVKLRRDRELPD
jgi:Arc/MetJ family transcription regulator